MIKNIKLSFALIVSCLLMAGCLETSRPAMAPVSAKPDSNRSVELPLLPPPISFGKDELGALVITKSPELDRGVKYCTSDSDGLVWRAKLQYRNMGSEMLDDETKAHYKARGARFANVNNHNFQKAVKTFEGMDPNRSAELVKSCDIFIGSSEDLITLELTFRKNNNMTWFARGITQKTDELADKWAETRGVRDYAEFLLIESTGLLNQREARALLIENNVRNLESLTQIKANIEKISYGDARDINVVLSYLADLKEAARKNITLIAQRDTRLKRETGQAEMRQKKDAQDKKERDQLVKSASIKSCDSFLSAFKSRYEDAAYNTDLTCEITSLRNALFVITSHSRFNTTKYYYQPAGDTVTVVQASGATSTLRASNFADIKFPLDMNADGDIQLRYLPKDQQAKVCERITTANNSMLLSPYFGAAVGGDAAHLAREGNFDFSVLKSGNSCRVRIIIAGIRSGNSVRKTATCGVRTVYKTADKKYAVRWMENDCY